MKTYQQIFGSDLIARTSRLYNIITVYNGSEFDPNHPEIFFSPQRKYIIDKLQKNEHSQKTGNLVKNIKNGQIVRFLKNKNLAGSLWSHFQRHYNHDDIFVITPSLYLLFLIHKYERFKNEEILMEMKELVQAHPCHFDFVTREARDSFPFNEDIVRELQVIQEGAVLDQKEHFQQLNNQLV